MTRRITVRSGSVPRRVAPPASAAAFDGSEITPGTITDTEHADGLDHDHDTPIATHAAIVAAHHSRYTDSEAAAKIAADALYLPIGGGTMGGVLNMGEFDISNVGNIALDSIKPDAADIPFYKADGTTISFVWDESDNRWEMDTVLLIRPNATAELSFEVTDQDTTDPYNLGVSNVSGRRITFAGIQGSLQQAVQFADAGSATTSIFGVAKSDNAGSSWQRRFVITQADDIVLYDAAGNAIFQWDQGDRRSEFFTSVLIKARSTSSAEPALSLEQIDVDEDFFKFRGTSDTSVDRALVDAVDFPNPGAIKGWVKISVQDDQGTNPIIDGDYYIPFHAAPTA